MVRLMPIELSTAPVRQTAAAQFRPVSLMNSNAHYCGLRLTDGDDGMAASASSQPLTNLESAGKWETDQDDPHENGEDECNCISHNLNKLLEFF